ncbi:MAG TPA: GNAT family N-acetyltransferase [Candidatus Avoscillospira avicola]|uniref:GNAT family N-acetyltransferase n=1 Tax=Candidatus Avoscillospira avicola TaxID=2840706 RepID=A0A9D1DHY3_9FIRM|nr:GNAT family N-acetyltransferase [Candidatus Avoscillospira avicola]
MFLRPYRPEDCPVLARLFYETVHTVNARDYSPQQLDAWADGKLDLQAFNASLLAHFALVAEEAGEIVGFGDMDKTGYLDRLYVHHLHQGRGVASALCDALEAHFAVPRYETHASITARPFFSQRGYQVIREQQVLRKGVLLTNFVMVKPALP